MFFERMVREDGSKCTKRNYSGKTRPPKNVTIVELHSSVKEVNAGFGLRKHKSLTEVVFNEGLQKIGDYSFWRCESLESITLPSTLIEIGDHAFYSCGLLKSILLPSNIINILVNLHFVLVFKNPLPCLFDPNALIPDFTYHAYAAAQCCRALGNACCSIEFVAPDSASPSCEKDVSASRSV